MPEISVLQERNRVFASGFDAGDLPMRPRMWTVVLTCVDARVVPSAFLGLELGDAFVIRNAGGRVTTAAVEDLAILSALGAHMPAPRHLRGGGRRDRLHRRSGGGAG